MLQLNDMLDLSNIAVVQYYYINIHFKLFTH